ncbi:MAG: crossover junction endodeoxyribonuclease RuvC [Dehalococcoidia bacterium]
MRILGIDPGTVSMGYGLVEDGEELRALHWGVLSPGVSLPLEQRLHRLYVDLSAMIREWQPQEVAVEDPFVARENRSVRTALAIGQAQGVALMAAASFGLPTFRYSPAQVKHAVADYGASTKEQVQEMVRLLLELSETPAPSDAADALALAICHLHQRRLESLLARETTR